MQTVKIQSINNTIATRVFIGDNHVEGVTSVSFEQSAGELPVFTFETHNYPNIEIDNVDIRFRFTPETVTDATKVIRHTYETDADFRNAFIASIESAIYDDGTVCDISDQHNLAVEIANRIIGVEK